jgi:hypothetical protein
VDGIQVHKVEAVSQSKSNVVWIYNTVCTGYTRSPLTVTIDAALPCRGRARGPDWPAVIDLSQVGKEGIEEDCGPPVAGCVSPRGELVTVHDIE